MAEEFKRITPEEVVEAYRKTGLKPICNGWYYTEPEKCGCGLTAVVLAGDGGVLDGVSLGCAEAVVLDELEGKRGVPYEYVDGFVEGFDGREKPCFLACVAGEIGYEDGEAAAKAVFGERV